MAAPLAPIVWTAARMGAVAAIAYYVKRRTSVQPKNIYRETAMNDTPDGVEVTAQRAEREANAHGSARLNRTFRLGPNGPGFEIDATALGRIRFRKID